MSATIDLRLKAIQDEFTFYRSQLQQTYLLAFEGSILAFMSPPLISQVSAYFPKHEIIDNPYSVANIFLFVMFFAWILLAGQACALVWPERKRPDVPARLFAILNEEKEYIEPDIFPENVDAIMTDIAKLRLIEEMTEEVQYLRRRRDTRMRLTRATLLAIGATVVASIVAEMVLVSHGFHVAS